MAIMRYWNTTWTNQAVVCESGTKSNESMIWEIPSRMKYFEQSNLYNLCFWDFRHGEEFRCPPPLTIKCNSQYMISLDRNPGLSSPILHLHPPLAISLWFDIDYSTYQLNMIGYDRKSWHPKNTLYCPPCLQLWHLRSAVVRVNPAKTTERCAISSCDILVSAWSSSRPKKYGTVFRMNSWPAKKKSRKQSGVNRLDSDITWPFRISDLGNQLVDACMYDIYVMPVCNIHTTLSGAQDLYSTRSSSTACCSEENCCVESSSVKPSNLRSKWHPVCELDYIEDSRYT